MKKLIGFLVGIALIAVLGYYLYTCGIFGNILNIRSMQYIESNDFGSGYVSKEEFEFKVGNKYKFKITNEKDEPIKYFGVYPTINGEAQADSYAMATSKETSIDYMSYCACKIYIYDLLNHEVDLAFYMVATHMLYTNYSGTEHFEIEKGKTYIIVVEFINTLGSGNCMFFANNSLSI